MTCNQALSTSYVKNDTACWKMFQTGSASKCRQLIRITGIYNAAKQIPLKRGVSRRAHFDPNYIGFQNR